MTSNVLNIPTSSPYGSFTIGCGPDGAAYDSANGDIYVTCFAYQDGYGNLSVVSGASNKVVATIPVGMEGGGAVYDSTNGDIYVINENSNNVTVVSGASNSVVANVPLPAGSQPIGAAYDSANGDIYVTDYGAADVSVVSGADNSVVANIPTGSQPLGAAYDSATGDIYVTNDDTNNVSVVSGATNTVVATVPVGANPKRPAYDAANGCIYIPNRGQGQSSMDVVSGASNKIVATIPVVGNQPDGAIYDSATGDIYVSNEESQKNANSLNMSVVSGASNTVVANIPVGQAWGGADGGAYDSANGDVYATLPGSNMVSVIPSNLSVATMATDTTGPAWLTVNFTALAAAGTYEYTSWNWSFGDGNSSILQNPSHTYVKEGSYQANVTVTDSNGSKATSGSVTVTVGSPMPFSMTQSRSFDDVGEPDWFNSSTRGNVGSLSYSYSDPPLAGCVASNNPVLQCTPTAVGNFTVYLNITDPYGHKWDLVSDTVRVFPALHVNLTISSSTPLLAQTVAFTANASGGNPPYNYTYLGLPYGCYSQNKSSIGCLPTQSDWYNITVVVRDLNNGTGRATVAIHVIFDFNVVVPASTALGQQLTILVNTNESFNGSAIATSHVTFAESGLPNKATWSITLGGTTENATVENATGTTLGFSEPNGTYPYTVGALTGYVPTPSSGSLTVS